MALSNFLETRMSDAKQLVALLSDRFDFVSVLGSDVRSLNVRANKYTSLISDGTDVDCGFVVKMWKGKAFFEYSVNDIAGDKTQLVQDILDSIRVDDTLTDRYVDTSLKEEEPLEKHFERASDLQNFSKKELLDFCVGLKSDLLAMDEHVLNAAAMLRTLNVNKLYASKNRSLTQSYCFVNGFIVVTYRDGDKIISAREGADSPNMSDVLQKLASKKEKLVQKARMLVTAKPIEPGVYDVILDPSVTGLLAHEAFGHGVEMDMFVKDRALAKHCIGTYVASPICNMHDGANAALSVASYFFDDDGVLASDTQIIKDGVLMRGISDLASASQLNTRPTGNGRRESHKRKAYTRMTNTFFESGHDKLEDMIASIKHGYMIFETNNGMEDPKNWQVQCVAEYGREIVDGKLTDNYVAPVVMSGYVPDVLKSITMISDDMRLEGAGMCGKGHKEWVRVSDGGPALKLKIKLG